MQNPKCRSQKNIFDSKGKYLKTACAVFSEKTYSESCIDEGMSLLTIDSQKVETQILQFATSLFGNSGRSTLWINGREQTVPETTTENIKSFYIDAIAIANADNNIFSEGSCYIVSSVSSPFKVDTWPCNTKMFSICEFKKPGAGNVL